MLPKCQAIILWHCWFYRPIRYSIWVMRCLHGCLSGSRCKWFSLHATATPPSLASLKCIEWYGFLMSANPGCPGKEAVKWVPPVPGSQADAVKTLSFVVNTERRVGSSASAGCTCIVRWCVSWQNAVKWSDIRVSWSRVWSTTWTTWPAVDVASCLNVLSRLSFPTTTSSTNLLMIVVLTLRHCAVDAQTTTTTEARYAHYTSLY